MGASSGSDMRANAAAQNAEIGKLKKEKNAIRGMYEQLNRDHEDLLVYLGHLQGQFEAAQKEIESLKQSAVNNAMRSRPESVESKMSDMEHHHAVNSQPKKPQSKDPYAPPDLMT